MSASLTRTPPVLRRDALAASARRAAPWLGLLVLTALLGAFLASFAVRVHTFQADEHTYVFAARELLANFPAALFDGEVFSLGPQRLNSVVQAAFLATLQTDRAFWAMHAAFAVLFASSAVPAWLLARGVGVRPWAALIPAAGVVLIPWAVLSTSLLTEPLAYPAFMWTAWATWRAAVRPSVANDALALGLLVVAMLARSSLAFLGLALVAVMVLHEWRLPSAEGRLPRRLWKRHPLLVVAAAAGAAVVVADQLTVRALTGTYPDLPAADLTGFPSKVRLEATHFAQGLLIVVPALGFGWAARALARAEQPAAHALAATTVFAAAAVVLSTVVSFPDERYVFYAAGPVLVCAIGALLLRQARAMWTLVAAAPLVWLVVSSDPAPDRGAYSHFFWAGETLWSRLVLGQVSVRAPGPLAANPELTAALGTAALAVIAALVVRHLRRPPAHVLAAAALVATGAVTTYYTLDKFVTTGGAGPEFRDLAFVDRSVPEGALVALAISGHHTQYAPVVETVRFFNDRAQAALTWGDDSPYDPSIQSVAHSDGSVRLQSEVEYVVTMPGYRHAALAGDVVASGPFPFPVELVRLQRPYRLRWLVQGADGAGSTGADGRAVVRVFPDAAPARPCLRMAVAAGSADGGPVTWRAAAGGTTRRGTLAPGEQPHVVVPLRGGVGRRGWPVRISARNAAGEATPLRVDPLGVERCAPAA